MIFLQIYFLTSQGSTKIPFINNNKVYGSDELQSLWLKVLTPIIMGTTEAAWVGGGGLRLFPMINTGRPAPTLPSKSRR